MSHTLPTRVLATVLGTACTIGTAWIILDEIPAWSAVTPKQYLSMLVLAVATFAMHRAIGDALQRRWLAAVPVALIASLAIALVMVVAGGRYSEQAANAQRLSDDRVHAYAEAKRRASNAHANLESARAAHAARVATADAMTADAFRDVQTACASGPGTFCRGAQATHTTATTLAAGVRVQSSDVTAAEIAARVADAVVVDAIPARVTAGDGAGFARLLATLGLVSDERATAIVLASLIPFALAVVVEIAAAAFFVLAFPPASQSTPVAPPADPMPALRAVATVAPLMLAPAAAQADDMRQGVAKLVAVLDAAAGKELTVTQLAKRMKCCRPEASKRIKAASVLVATRKDGRYLYVTRS